MSDGGQAPGVGEPPEDGPEDRSEGGAAPDGGGDRNENGHEDGEMGAFGPGIGVGEAVGEDRSLATVAKERDEYLDALRRLQADFENYKKRVIKQQTEHLERAAENLVVKLLPVLDALDLAVAHAGDSSEGKVVEPIAASLFDALKKEGLERIDPRDQPFDPNQHDAVLHEPREADEASEEHEGGGGEPQVSDVMRAGYRWKGRVLRPAMVKVKG